ncbi:hypothetical protein [Mycolicibacterium phocaicum]|uniref:Uncharacterized protein n=1 Tax=Mycolicibacterium phocaicum TaxID=319706 RepID=A0A7I7ZS25_9MYCO|nr:hypothetical protein [Mycolicibacterium phocaicum]TLH61006.1 hypothetical protein C1S79_25795 [Mycolicibacterium phocaicum]BBZ57068.1 hypothetical protein MPHO_40600 [Mycolicibacterium phocaicum]
MTAQQNTSQDSPPDPFNALLAGVHRFAGTKDESTGREVLIAAVKQYLSELTADEFAALEAEVRPPDEDSAQSSDGPVYPASWGFKPTPTN